MFARIQTFPPEYQRINASRKFVPPKEPLGDSNPSLFLLVPEEKILRGGGKKISIHPSIQFFPRRFFQLAGERRARTPHPKVDPHSLQSLGRSRAPSPGGCLRATSRGAVAAYSRGGPAKSEGVKRGEERVASLATSIVRHWCMATRVCKKRVNGGRGSRVVSRHQSGLLATAPLFFLFLFLLLPFLFFSPCRVDKKLRSNYSGSLNESRERGRFLAVDP